MLRTATVTLAIGSLLALSLWHSALGLAISPGIAQAAAPSRPAFATAESAGDANWTWMRQAHEHAARFGDDSPQPDAF